MSGSGNKVDECSGLPLIEGNPLLDELLSASEHIVYRLDFVRGGYDFISPRAATELGVPLAELHARGVQLLREFLCEEDGVRCFAQLAALCAAAPGRAQSVCLEYRLRDAAGKHVWYSDSMTVLSDAAGRLLSTCGIAMDITQRREQERALKDTGHRYAALFEGAQDAILVADVESGLIVDANVEAELLFLRPREELIGLSHLAVLPPALAQHYHDAFVRHVRAGGGGPDEMMIQTADGDTIVVEASSNVIETASGHRLIQGVFRDIRQRKRVETELKLAARVFESSQEAIIITDAAARIVSVNPAFSAMTGYEAGEVVGKNPCILGAGRQPAEFFAGMWRDIEREDHWQGEIWNRRKSGEVYPVWLTISVLPWRCRRSAQLRWH